eukprot:15340717-Ditylum_brightwellii.AAC.1
MGKCQRRALSQTDLKFQHPSGIDQMTVYVDAAHIINLKNCRTIGGHVAIMVDTLIAYSTKWHQMVLTSFTGAEFIQATSATKMVKYLRMILTELRIEQKEPTMVYEDNTTAMMMANANKPNGRIRYIDISYFSI